MYDFLWVLESGVFFCLIVCDMWVLFQDHVVFDCMLGVSEKWYMNWAVWCYFRTASCRWWRVRLPAGCHVTCWLSTSSCTVVCLCYSMIRYPTICRKWFWGFFYFVYGFFFWWLLIICRILWIRYSYKNCNHKYLCFMIGLHMN
jgi:hypothetical protein